MPSSPFLLGAAPQPTPKPAVVSIGAYNQDDRLIFVARDVADSPAAIRDAVAARDLFEAKLLIRPGGWRSPFPVTFHTGMNPPWGMQVWRIVLLSDIEFQFYRDGDTPAAHSLEPSFAPVA